MLVQFSTPLRNVGRIWSVLSAAVLLLVPAGGSAQAARLGQQDGSQHAECTYFVATGHNLCGGFKAYWEAYGGLAIFGYPLSEEIVENGRTVQYFERARFEWHPGVWPERYDVLLGHLGMEYAETAGLLGTEPFTNPTTCPPADRESGCVFFPATGHVLAGPFRAYWEQYGGLAVFGYPISAMTVDQESGLTVQYFERARFEWHPGAWPERYDVLLSRLGADLVSK